MNRIFGIRNGNFFEHPVNPVILSKYHAGMGLGIASWFQWFRNCQAMNVRNSMAQMSMNGLVNFLMGLNASFCSAWDEDKAATRTVMKKYIFLLEIVFALALIANLCGCRTAHTQMPMQTSPIYGEHDEDMKEYDRKVIQVIQNRWYEVLKKKPNQSFEIGNVVVAFYLRFDGSVRSVRVVNANVNEVLRSTCLEVIRDSAPFDPWTEAMHQRIKADYREVHFTFYYE